MSKLAILFIVAAIVSAISAQDCTSPLVTGRCRGLMKAYGFDTKIGKCKQFNYGGCGGNGNRYRTLQECQDACENVCGLPLVVGPCKAAFRVYGYDNELGACRQFIYGGCGGNGNRFQTLEACQDACESYYYYYY